MNQRKPGLRYASAWLPAQHVLKLDQIAQDLGMSRSQVLKYLIQAFSKPEIEGKIRQIRQVEHQ